MSADLNVDLGRHCSFDSCNRLDFLPVKCDKCLLYFCKEHSSLTAHTCTKLGDAEARKEPVVFNSAVNAFSCHYDKCSTKEIIEFTCEFCHVNFCMLHRLQPDHQCVHLKQNVSNESGKKQQQEFHFEVKQNVSEKNAKLAAKLLVMKLRQTAQGPPGLPEESKLYCFIQYTADALIKKPFYFSTKWPVGRCIEFLFEKLNIHKSLLTKIKLFHEDRLVDSSLTVEEFAKRNSLCHGVVLDLKNI